MNGPLRLDATSWSPVGALVGNDNGTIGKPRRGPSILFAACVISVVILVTFGTVRGFLAVRSYFGEPTSSASDTTIGPKRPVATASLADSLPETDARPATSATELTADVQGAATDIDAPDPQDPRWARTGNLVAAPTVTAVAAAPEAGRAAEPDASLHEADDPTDGTETAAIPPDQTLPPRAVQPAKAEQPAADDAATTGDPMRLVTRARPAQVSRSVNMRARPKSGSPVLLVIPAGANVQLVGCTVWCEIIYKDRHGYVFKDFLGGGAGNIAASGRPKNVKAAQAKPANGDQPAPTNLPGVEVPHFKPLSSRLQ